MFTRRNRRKTRKWTRWGQRNVLEATQTICSLHSFEINVHWSFDFSANSGHHRLALHVNLLSLLQNRPQLWILSPQNSSLSAVGENIIYTNFICFSLHVELCEDVLSLSAISVTRSERKTCSGFHSCLLFRSTLSRGSTSFRNI